MPPQFEFLRWVANGLIFWAALVGTASVVVHLRVRWWETEIGRHLLAYMTCVAAVLLLASFRILFGDSWWFQIIRLVVFVGIPVTMTQRFYLQLKAQRRSDDETEGR